MEPLTRDDYLYIAKKICLMPFRIAFDMFILFFPFYVLSLALQYYVQHEILREPHVRGFVPIWTLSFLICVILFNTVIKDARRNEFLECTNSAFDAVNSILTLPVTIIFTAGLVYLYFLATPSRIARWAVSVAAVAAFQTTCVVASLLSPVPEALSLLQRDLSIVAVLLMAVVGLMIGSYAGRTSIARRVEDEMSRAIKIEPRAAKVVLAALVLLYTSLRLLAFKQTNLEDLFLLLHFRRQPSAIWTVTFTLLLWGLGFLTLIDTVSRPQTRAFIATTLLWYVAAIFAWPHTAATEFKWENFHWKSFACGDNLSLKVLLISYWVVVCASAGWSLIQHLVMPPDSTPSLATTEEGKVPQEVKTNEPSEKASAHVEEAV